MGKLAAVKAEATDVKVEAKTAVKSETDDDEESRFSDVSAFSDSEVEIVEPLQRTNADGFYLSLLRGHS